MAEPWRGEEYPFEGGAYVIRGKGISGEGTFTASGAYSAFAASPQAARNCAFIHHDLAFGLLCGLKVPGFHQEDSSYGLYLKPEE